MCQLAIRAVRGQDACRGGKVVNGSDDYCNDGYKGPRTCLAVSVWSQFFVTWAISILLSLALFPATCLVLTLAVERREGK